jgi:ureidoacrylate peracid hydrolase
MNSSPIDPSVSHQPEILSALSDKVRPEHTALLIVDMQNDLIDPKGKTAAIGKRDISHSRAVIPEIQRLAASAREAGALVVYILGTTLTDMRGASGPWLDARSWAAFTVPDICMDGSWGQEIIEELTPEPTDLQVKKYRYGAFNGTNLELILQSAGCKTVICAGVSTNACVEFTAREAFAADFYVVYAKDALASWDMRLHEATLDNAAKRYAAVVSTDELESAWGLASGEAGGSSSR